MEEKKDGLTVRQLLAIAGVGFLSPALRLIPGQCAVLAGRGAWLSPLLAIPALLLLNWMISRLMARRRCGEGMGGMVRRALGHTGGNVAPLVFSGWLTFYAGFLLRSGAERFVTAIYPRSAPGLFVWVMLLLSLVATLGPTRALGRCAEIFRPLLLAGLGLVLLFAFAGFRVQNLLPVTPRQLPALLLGALPAVDVTGLILLCVSFAEGLTPGDDRRARRYGRWAVLACCFLSALTAASIGRFGAEFTADMSNPFFVLVRNASLFGSVQRIEALVTALWVLPDFVLVTLVLRLASAQARRALAFPRRANGGGPWELGNGRWLIVLTAALALLAALTMAPTDRQLTFLSERLVPIVSLSFSFGGVGLVLLAGRLRHTI